MWLTSHCLFLIYRTKLYKGNLTFKSKPQALSSWPKCPPAPSSEGAGGLVKGDTLGRGFCLFSGFHVLPAEEY